MAEGIRKRHSEKCPGRRGRRCTCKAGWEAAVYLPREQRRVTRTFPTRAEARTWRADAIRAPGRTERGPSSGGDLTLAEALGVYVEGMRTGRVRPKGRERYKPNTTRSYERVVRVYIAPSAVGQIRVARLRRRDLQEFADELHAAGLSAGTISNILNPVQAFFRRAIDRDELSYNPSERIDLPHGRSKRPKRIASKEEAATLLGVLDATIRPVWATAFYAGLRRGELQALRVCDIDFEAHLIAVERGWDQVEGVIEPKSDAGRRTVPMLAILADYLAADLRRTGRSGEDLIFGRTTEQAFYASTIDYGAKKAWKTASAAAAGEDDEALSFPRRITLHECRHTFASLLIDAGANPKAIQQFMGHSKIQTTFDVYGHLLPGSHDEVRERMDGYLRGEGH
ncbi:MAG TPA: tyrosine-type recombinase/integrase [Solirubrobacterales bacterium]|nr:tyrosine-type recombinase/integrase [Solirubrobacterales bacterium]